MACACGGGGHSRFRRFPETFQVRGSPTPGRLPAHDDWRPGNRGGPLVGVRSPGLPTRRSPSQRSISWAVARFLACAACEGKCQQTKLKHEDDCEAAFESCCKGLAGCGGPELKAYCNQQLEWCQAYAKHWYDACRCKCEFSGSKCFPLSCPLV